MINIKDIRVGNNVISDGVIHTVHGIFKYGLILDEDYEEGEEFVYEPIDKIEGVKLTLNLLKQEGATCKSYGYGDNEWYQCNIQGCTLNQSGDKFTYDGNEIEFLHELQNIFYFNHNKIELTL